MQLELAIWFRTVGVLNACRLVACWAAFASSGQPFLQTLFCLWSAAPTIVSSELVTIVVSSELVSVNLAQQGIVSKKTCVFTCIPRFTLKIALDEKDRHAQMHAQIDHCAIRVHESSDTRHPSCHAVIDSCSTEQTIL